MGVGGAEAQAGLIARPRPYLRPSGKWVITGAGWSAGGWGGGGVKTASWLTAGCGLVSLQHETTRPKSRSSYSNV